MTEIKIENLERLPEAAAQFIAAFTPELEEGRVFAFYAPMGTGKTTFISEVSRQLGSDDETGSPTFSIVNEYDIEGGRKLYHLDCYRLDSEEDALEIGIEDYFDSGSPCLVEWPERIEGLLPENAVLLEIKTDESGQRTISQR